MNFDGARDALHLGTMSWERVVTGGTAPHPAAHVACASAGRELVVFGGYAGSYANTAHFFNAERRMWTRAEPAGTPPKGRQGASLTRVAGALYLVGGSDDVQSYNDVHVLQSDGSSWRTPDVRCAPAPCTLPAAREGHSATLVGKKLWIFGGVGRLGRSYVSLSDLRYLDVETFTWHDPTKQLTHTEFAPVGRSLHASLALGARFLVLGGMVTPARTALGDARLFDAETFGWSQPLAVGQPPPPRSGASATLRGRSIYVMGGCDERHCTDELRVMTSKYVRRVGPASSVSFAGPDPRGSPISARGSVCASNCSSHGTCWQGRCLCNPGYEGYDCSQPSQCDCSSRGVCAHGRCFCDPGFDGERCELAARCLNSCSGHGQCMHGRCACAAGYTGLDCSELVPCPLGCSGRGICVSGGCLCMDGFLGEGCERSVPCLGEPECAGHGECFEGRCLCEPGYAGADCSEALPCPDGCRDDDGVRRGTCVHGACCAGPGPREWQCAGRGRGRAGGGRDVSAEGARGGGALCAVGQEGQVAEAGAGRGRGGSGPGAGAGGQK